MDRLSRRGRGGWRPLFILLAAAFALRAGWGLSQGGGEASVDPGLPDQVEYLTLARNLLAGHGLQLYDARFNAIVHAYRTPGYPLLVAAVGAKVRLIRLAQAAIDASTVLAIYLLALALLPGRARQRRGAWVAAGCVAFNPFLIYFAALILSETLFTALLAWGMLLLITGGRGARLRWDDDADEGEAVRAARPGRGTLQWLLGGTLLAMSALVRPSAVPLPIVMGIGAALLNRPPAGAYDAYRAPRGVRRLARAPVGTTLLLLTLLILAPWAIRNKVVLGQWVWTTTNGGVTLYDGFNPDATGGSDQSFLAAMPQLKQMGEIDRSQYLQHRAQAFIREDLGRAARLAWVKAGRTWSPVPLSETYGSPRRRIIALLYTIPFDLLVLIGLLTGGLSRGAKVFLLLPAIYFTGVHMLSVGSLRYRIPIEPPLAVIAGSVLVTPAPRWRRSVADGSKTAEPSRE